MKCLVLCVDFPYFDRSIRPFDRSYNIMRTLKCNDNYHRLSDTRRERDKKMYVCAFLLTNFCVLCLCFSNNQFMCSCKWLIAVSAICQYAQTLVLRTKDISVSRSQLREKKPREVLVCYWYWSVIGLLRALPSMPVT
jgi:hypothetical protein